jgi:chromosome segregation ATPase
VSSATLIEVLLGLIAAAIGISSYLQAKRANNEQARMTIAQAAATSATVDAGAFVRAKDIYEGALATLREELGTTRREMQDLRESNRSLLTELEKVRRETYEARASNDGLKGEITKLRAEIGRLKEAG